MTLGAPKLPLVLPPAESKSGEVVIADIGIPADVIEQLEGPRIELLTREQMRPLIQPRARRCAQGRLRPRAGGRRIDGEGRRGGVVRARRDARGRRSRDGGVTAIVPGDRSPRTPPNT